MELIKDKVAIVTGAAAGIGAGVAGLFAENGAHVFLADLDGRAGQKGGSESKSQRRSRRLALKPTPAGATPWQKWLRMRFRALGASIS